MSDFLKEPDKELLAAIEGEAETSYPMPTDPDEETEAQVLSDRQTYVVNEYATRRSAAIAADRATLDAKVIEKLDQLETNYPAIRASRKLLQFGKREEKLRDWAEVLVKKDAQRAEHADEEERDAQRTGMRQQWDALAEQHEWIEDFREQFTSVNILLNEGKDGLARKKLQRIRVPAVWNEQTGKAVPSLTTQEMAVFEQIKAGFAAQLDTLKPRRE